MKERIYSVDRLKDIGIKKIMQINTKDNKFYYNHNTKELTTKSKFKIKDISWLKPFAKGFWQRLRIQLRFVGQYFKEIKIDTK